MQSARPAPATNDPPVRASRNPIPTPSNPAPPGAPQCDDGNMAIKDGCNQFCVVEVERGFSCARAASPDLPDVCTCSCQCQFELPDERKSTICTCQDETQKRLCGIDADGVKIATGKKSCAANPRRRRGPRPGRGG